MGSGYVGARSKTLKKQYEYWIPSSNENLEILVSNLLELI